MISFKQWLLESAMQRKFEYGNGATPINHPETTIVHHDPEKQLTVYHMHSPKALKDCTSGMDLCTHRPNYAELYLRKGNLFMVHKGNQREQVFIPKKTSDAFFETSHDIEMRHIAPLLPKLEKIPHYPPLPMEAG